MINLHLSKPSLRVSHFLSLRHLAYVTLFVNVALPKGGFYIHSVPVTWGYVLLGLTGTLTGIAVLLRRFKVNFPIIIMVALLTGFSVYSLVTLAVLGHDPALSFGLLLSYYVSISIVPVFALLSTCYLLKKGGLTPFLALLRSAFILVVAWGIIHFVAMNAFDTFVGVPYLTTTGSQLDIATTRAVNRGSVLKMVSTYNNGNILGINLLLWFPLVLEGGRKLAKRFAVPSRALFLLSLSRTVWAGWIFSEVLTRTFGVRRLRSLILVFFLAPLAAGLVVYVATLWFASPLEFIFDPGLGGRRAQLEQTVSLLPQPFDGVREIVFASIVSNLGVVGLLFFVVTWGFPLLLPVRTRAARLAKVGLATYFFLMLSDGAFTLVPTQYTYWMVVGVVCSARFTGARFYKGSYD